MKHESKHVTSGSRSNTENRNKIFELSKAFSGTEDEKERNRFLFIKASDVARFLAVNELYLKIKEIPGCVADFGTWRGQTAVMCENLRAIYEPLNFDRRIYCFDTFTGYKGFQETDRSSNLHRDGTYSTEHNYEKFLEELLVSHEGANAQGHNTHKHTVVKGDIRQTLPVVLDKNRNEFFSLLFFDLNIYEVTKTTFDYILPRIPIGGIVAFWQLTRKNTVLDAEGKFFVNELISNSNFIIKKCKTYPSLVYLIKQA